MPEEYFPRAAGRASLAGTAKRYNRKLEEMHVRQQEFGDG
jgi:hypothetical protein